jgi:ubiquinone/menaquinone biosynthesis C-methylase UbiE
MHNATIPSVASSDQPTDDFGRPRIDGGHLAPSHGRTRLGPHDPNFTLLERRQLERSKVLAPHFDALAENWEQYRSRNAYYHNNENLLFRTYVRKGASVLELGCATGDLLASLEPARGIGIDVSSQMLEIARRKHPHLTFLETDAIFFETDERFDTIIVNNLLEYVEDIQGLFRTCRRLLKPRGRLLISSLNPLWSPIVRAGARLGVGTPEFSNRNFVTGQDTANLLHLNGFDVVKRVHRTLMPKNVPVLSSIINLLAGQLPLLRSLCMTEFLVARPAGASADYSVSVIVPCYNEADSIAECVRRVPPMGSATEVIVVDDGSRDGTADRVRPELNPDVDVRLISYQPNRGKLNAVRAGFEAARGDILMILDADATVPPEDLPYFYLPLSEGQADFINGTRLIYPLANGSMKFQNFVGNNLFGVLMSWLTGVHLSDTLCGTKAFFRDDYNHFQVGDDPWGDFDWLFGAAQSSCKVLEVPIHYEERRAGQSKMKALRHTCALLKACWSAFWRIKYPCDFSPVVAVSRKKERSTGDTAGNETRAAAA